MAFGMHMKLEATISRFTVELSRFLDAFEGDNTVVVDAEHPCERDCDADTVGSRERFWAYCRFMNFPNEPEPGLKLTLTPRG